MAVTSSQVLTSKACSWGHLDVHVVRCSEEGNWLKMVIEILFAEFKQIVLAFCSCLIIMTCICSITFRTSTPFSNSPHLLAYSAIGFSIHPFPSCLDGIGNLLTTYSPAYWATYPSDYIEGDTETQSISYSKQHIIRISYELTHSGGVHEVVLVPFVCAAILEHTV